MHLFIYLKSFKFPFLFWAQTLCNTPLLPYKLTQLIPMASGVILSWPAYRPGDEVLALKQVKKMGPCPLLHLKFALKLNHFQKQPTPGQPRHIGHPFVLSLVHSHSFSHSIRHMRASYYWDIKSSQTWTQP